MKSKCRLQIDLTQDVHFTPNLDAAIATWKKARHEFENERSKNHQDAYMKATDELGQAISPSGLLNSALTEQVGLDFWTVEVPEGASGL